MSHRVLILGGGITGLTAAWRALEHGLEPVLIEASSATGGMGASAGPEGFVIDHGIHGLYSAREETEALVREMVERFGGDFLPISKKTSIFFHGRYLNYPMGVKELFRALPLLTSATCVLDFLRTRLRGRLRDIGVAASFEEWVADRFGHSLYKIYFGPYVEKVWGIPGARMSSAWLARRVSTISIASVIRRALRALFTRRAGDEMHSLQPQSFLYPPRGSGQFVDRVRDAALEGGAQLLLEHRARAVRRVEESWEVEVQTPAGHRIERGDALVSTLPLPVLIELLGERVPAAVRAAASALEYRAMVLVNLFLERPRVFRDQWVYYSAPELPFNRINEFTNLGPGFSPAGKTALNCEITCFRGDPTWRSADEELREACVRALCELDLIEPAQIFDYSVARLPNAYPIFAVGTEERLAEVLSFIANQPLLYTIGRQGRFEYINMDECIWHASKAIQGASHTLRGTRGEGDEAA